MFLEKYVIIWHNEDKQPLVREWINNKHGITGFYQNEAGSAFYIDNENTYLLFCLTFTNAQIQEIKIPMRPRSTMFKQT